MENKHNEKRFVLTESEAYLSYTAILNDPDFKLAMQVQRGFALIEQAKQLEEQFNKKEIKTEENGQ